MTNQAAPATISAAKAERLATAIETIAEDRHAPIEVSPRIHRETGEVQSITVAALLPDCIVSPGTSDGGTALCISDQLEGWAEQLLAVSKAIKERYPLQQVPPGPESGFPF